MVAGAVRRNRPGGAARLHLLQSLDDHLFAVTQRASDNPAGPGHAMGLQAALYHLAIRIDRQGIGTLVITYHGGLRQHEGTVDHAGRQPQLDEHARQQLVVRVGQHGAQRQGARAGVDREVGKIERAGLRVGRAVRQRNLHPCLG